MSEPKTETCFKISRVLQVVGLLMLSVFPIAVIYAGPIALAWFFGFLAVSTIGTQLNRAGRMGSVLDLVKEVNEHNERKAANTA
jgi:hypothetical protein